MSEVIEKALDSGPQIVTRRGKETAVILSFREYKNLKQPKVDLVGFFNRSPLKGLNLDLERSKDLPREVSI